MPNPDSDYITINGRRYPSHYSPQNPDPDLKVAWEILDGVKDGVIPDHIRAYLAGAITAKLKMARRGK